MKGRLSGHAYLECLRDEIRRFVPTPPPPSPPAPAAAPSPILIGAVVGSVRVSVGTTSLMREEREFRSLVFKR